MLPPPGCSKVECWYTIVRKLGPRVKRRMPAESTFDGVEVLHFAEEAAARRCLREAAELPLWLASVDSVVVSPRFGRTWGLVSQLSESIVVFPLKRRREHSREWMQQYWQLMHGPTVVDGMGTARSGLAFVSAANPHIQSYQQWHALGQDSEWDGVAVLRFGAPPPPLLGPSADAEAALRDHVNDVLLRDEERFIDLPSSEFFVAAPVVATSKL